MFSVVELYGEINSAGQHDHHSPPGKTHYEAINAFLDYTIPGSTSVDLRWIDSMIETAAFQTQVTGVTVAECFRKLRYDPKPIPRNNIRSQQYQPRSSSLRMQLATFEKRNFNYDNTLHHIPCEPVIDQLLDRFFLVYTRREARPCTSPLIEPSVTSLLDWVQSRQPGNKRALMTELEKKPLLQELLVKYNIMVKSDVKPKLDASVLSEVVSGQNIVYHKKIVNAIFSHVFQLAVERFKDMLKDNVLLYHGMDTKQFASATHNILHRPLIEYYCAELDISKFDKSQNAFTKTFELNFYKRLGVPGDIVDMWASTEFESSVISSSGEFRCDIGSQRRSGSATTWFGNTVISMMLCCLAVDIPELKYMAFSGDDSLLLADDRFHINTTTVQDNYGFQCKPVYDAAPYFCSKYLIQTKEGSLAFVPDPYKLCVKLGSDLEDDEVLRREKFISFLDTTCDMNSEATASQLAYYHQRKYGPNPWVYCAVAAINSVRSNFSQYCRLWMIKGADSLTNV